MRTMTLLHLSCICLGHGNLDLAGVNFVLSIVIGDDADLSERVDPVQSYLLSSKSESNMFNNASSKADCVELIDFCRTANEPVFIPWTYVDFFSKDEILKVLMKCYKEIRVAAAVDGDTSDVSNPDALCIKSSLPAQFLKIDVSKVTSAESDELGEETDVPGFVTMPVLQKTEFYAVDDVFITVVCLAVLCC